MKKSNQILGIILIFPEGFLEIYLQYDIFTVKIR